MTMARNNDEPLLEPHRAQLRRDEATGSYGIWEDKPEVVLCGDMTAEDCEVIRSSIYTGAADPD